MNLDQYKGLTVDEVKEQLEAGALTSAQVRELEGASGKNRKTVLALVGEAPAPEPTIRPTGPRAFHLDPDLAAERERNRQRVLERRTPSKPTLDPALVEERERTIARQEQLRGTSLRTGPGVIKR